MSNTEDGPSIRELKLLTQQKICRLLDVRNENVSGNFKTLAAEVGMSITDFDLVSQGKEPTHSVLSWWGRRPEATIPKLREIFVSMERYDCVQILDEDLKAGTGCLAFHVLFNNNNNNNKLTIHSHHYIIIICKNDFIKSLVKIFEKIYIKCEICRK